MEMERETVTEAETRKGRSAGTGGGTGSVRDWSKLAETGGGGERITKRNGEGTIGMTMGERRGPAGTRVTVRESRRKACQEGD